MNRHWRYKWFRKETIAQFQSTDRGVPQRNQATRSLYSLVSLTQILAKERFLYDTCFILL